MFISKQVKKSKRRRSRGNSISSTQSVIPMPQLEETIFGIDDSTKGSFPRRALRFLATHSIPRYGLVALVTAGLAIAIQVYVLYPSLPLVYDGFVSPGFEKVEEVFRSQLESGAERGGSFAAYHKGRLVVDLWGGYADRHAGQPWTHDTVSKWWSVTKAVSSICLAVLVDRGHLDYELPVSSYWPKFSQHGKENITVKELLSHQAGLLVFDEPFDSAILTQNHVAVAEVLERQKPEWHPGTKQGYHVASFGMYADQLIRRADPKGRGVKDFFNQEIADIFDIDFHIGLPSDLHYRAARLDSNNLIRTFLTVPWGYFKCAIHFILWRDSTLAKAAKHPEDLFTPPFEKDNRRDRREVDFASSQGYGTARAVARLFGILANGGHDDNGTMLISKETLEWLSRPATIGHDEIILTESMYSMGMFLYRRFEDTPKERLVFGHPGVGGQAALVDLEEELAWGYVTNHMSAYVNADYPVFLNLEKALYDSVHNL